jgi:hypothetical protein
MVGRHHGGLARTLYGTSAGSTHHAWGGWAGTSLRNLYLGPDHPTRFSIMEDLAIMAASLMEDFDAVMAASIMEGLAGRPLTRKPEIPPSWGPSS